MRSAEAQPRRSSLQYQASASRSSMRSVLEASPRFRQLSRRQSVCWDPALPARLKCRLEHFPPSRQDMARVCPRLGRRRASVRHVPGAARRLSSSPLPCEASGHSPPVQASRPGLTAGSTTSDAFSRAPCVEPHARPARTPFAPAASAAPPSPPAHRRSSQGCPWIRRLWAHAPAAPRSPLDHLGRARRSRSLRHAARRHRTPY